MGAAEEGKDAEGGAIAVEEIERDPGEDHEHDYPECDYHNHYYHCDEERSDELE